MTRTELAHRFGKNMEQERIRLGLSQIEMAEALDMSLSAYKRIITGETLKIDLYTIRLMYKLTHKFAHELCNESDEFSDAIHHLRELPPSRLKTINAIIDFEMNFHRNNTGNPEEEDFLTTIVPTGNMEDGMIYDSCSLEKVNIAPCRKRYGDIFDCGLHITSHHLHPVYQKDDILLLKRQSPRDGDTGIFIHTPTGRIYVRTFRQTNPCQLLPLNDFGSIIELNLQDADEMSQWVFFGIVITKLRA